MADAPAAPDPKRKSALRLLVIVLVLLALSAAAVALLALRRHHAERARASQLLKTEREGRRVQTAWVKRSPAEKQLLLLGEARAFFSVTLYARVSGYMTGFYADIGDDVKQGQLLATIESPETEQSYLSALADATNKKRIADREKTLRRSKLVSQQETDQAVAAAKQAAASLRTEEVLRGYERVLAPFDGRITERFLDPGTLIQNASGSQSASQPLFTISQIDRLRVFVYVDQAYAPLVRVGDPVELSLPSRPAERFAASVAQIAGELDPRTRTQLVEIHMDNRAGKIVAGSFLQVTMRISTPSFLELPVQALVFRDKEPVVPVVERDGRIHYAKIDLAENDGEEIRIRSGVSEGERVALNVGDSLREGQKVQPATPPGEAAGRAGQAGGDAEK